MTAGTQERTGGRAWQLSAEARTMLEKFPPRPVPASWPATRQPRGKVVARLLAPPFEAATSQDRCNRKLALLKVLDWLGLHPGRTWQERWNHATGGGDDWRDVLIRELSDAENLGPRGDRLFKILGPGVTQLITADVIRPFLSWLMTTPSPQRIANETERVRDPAGVRPAAGSPRRRDVRERDRRPGAGESRAHPGRQGRHSRRHHRRGLPGTGEDQQGPVPPARRGAPATARSSTRCCVPPGSSPPRRRRRYGCSAACSRDS